MMMRTMEDEFLHHAPCPNCGSSDALGVYTSHTYCFSCGKSSSKRTSKGPTTGYRTAVDREMWIPDDIVTTVPYEAHEWLKKYKLTMKEMIDNKVVWSDRMKLMIFMYAKHGILLGWQGRYFGDDPKKPKWWSKGDLKKINHIIGNGDTLVLVEDIVSAIKVARLTACKPMFGSHVDVGDMLKIGKDYHNVILWHDYDKRKESHKYSTKLNSLGIKTRVVTTRLDPKDLSTEDIENTLKMC